MALVTGALGSVIPKLCELVKDEYNLQTGLKKKIACLTRDLESMHAALRKVADVPPDQLDEEVKLWARDVRELSYDVDGILDHFLVRIDGREARDPNRFKRVTKKIGKLFSKSKARHQIDGMIKIINEQADLVAERHRRYRAEDIVAKPAAKSTVDPRLAAMYKEVTQLVGIEKPSAQLISMMSLAQGDEASNKKMKIVSVVGTGGLGKTTLAKVVYEKVKVDFQSWAFVSVGRDPDLKKVFRDILIELDRNKYMDPKMTILDEKQLMDELREYLRSKRYFIVIDDIWEIQSWQMIELALVQDNCGISRLITTTRNLEVARECGVVYKLEHLPFDASKKLFCTRVFGSEGKCHDTQIDEASDKILKKCDGVPLAIITMASLLVGKSRQEWFEMCHSIIFRDKKKNQQLSDTEWILSLSYYDLPAHLKTCLLYLSAFPEDYVIVKDSLIWKWVAEGFVHSEESGTSLFEVGEGYFNELVNRSLIQTDEDECGGVRGCHLHDMVLDLLRARSLEENFITISRNTNIVEGTSSPCSRVRRLVLQNKIEEETHQDSLLGIDLSHVRTFISCGCDIFMANKVRRFELLRVLALEDCKSVNLEHIEKLLHLRYIGISGITAISGISEGIGALKFLQTLMLDIVDIVWNEKVPKFPSTLGLLTQLTCLHAGEHTVPSGVIGKLTCLEELELRIHYPDMFVKELGKLRELKVLICHFGSVLNKSVQSDLVKCLRKCLRNLHKLKRLILNDFSGNILEKSIWDAVVFSRALQRLRLGIMIFTGLPSCINPSDLPNLTVLDMNVEDLDEQGLKSLGTLPELRSLTLRTQSTVTITVNDGNDGFFHKLRFCRLWRSTILFVLNEDLSFSFTLWSHANDAVAFGSRKAIVQAPSIMPNLEVLKFRVGLRTLILNNGSCDKLGLEYLPSLQKVEVFFRDDDEKEEAALRHEIEVHPNRPTLQLCHRVNVT